MAYAPLTKIPQQFFDNLGNPLVSGTLYAYLAGTSTPTNMYSDNAGTVAGTSVVLDSRGEPTTFKLIWLNTTIIYKFVLKDSTGTTIWTIDNISGDDGTGNTASSVFDQQTITATAGQTIFNLGYEYVTGTNAMAVYKNGSRLITGTDFTETSSTSVTLTMAAIVGDEYTFIGGQDVSSAFSSSNVSFSQSGTGATIRSVQTKLRETVSVKDFGAVGDGVTDDTAAIQAAENACATSLQALWFPAGTYRCNSGLTKKAVNWIGAGRYNTILDFRGSGTFINATGTTGSRVICTIRDLDLVGQNANVNAVGISCGWNQRAKLLDNVRIYKFGKYGIYFNDQNWIVSFYDVMVDQCGQGTSNGAGIFKETTIDLGTWNDIKFYGLNVENCGRTDSTAGGVFLQTTTANRGLYFVNCDVEGSLGTNEIYVSNMADVSFVNLYLESVTGPGPERGVNLEGCTATFSGGFLTGSNTGTNLIGVRAVNGSGSYPNRVSFNGTTIVTYASSINLGSGQVYTTMLGGDRIFANLDTASQWFGDYSPRVSAHKNGTNQTAVASGTFTKVTFGSSRYDLTSAFASSTFTPRTIGTYQIDACVTWLAAANTDGLIVAVYVNGAAYKSIIQPASGTGQQSVQINAQVDTVGTSDTIEIWARQTSGSAQDINGAQDRTWFMASLIGRAA